MRRSPDGGWLGEFGDECTRDRPEETARPPARSGGEIPAAFHRARSSVFSQVAEVTVNCCLIDIWEALKDVPKEGLASRTEHSFGSIIGMRNRPMLAAASTMRLSTR